MKALRLIDWKTEPELVQVPTTTPGPGEVVVKIGVGVRSVTTGDAFAVYGAWGAAHAVGASRDSRTRHRRDFGNATDFILGARKFLDGLSLGIDIAQLVNVLAL